MPRFAIMPEIEAMLITRPDRRFSIAPPTIFVQTNVLATTHVLDACRASDTLERVVLTSTSEVYGTAQYVPIDERHPLRGQSPSSRWSMSRM